MYTVFYTKKEEIANSLSHGAGVMMGVVAGYFLLLTAIQSDNSWSAPSVLLYLFGMLSSYISSTCYHSCRISKRKEFFRKLDHGAIYLHIAGSYVPFTLLILRHAGAWGWTLFTFNWIAAILGIYMSFRKLKTHSNLETICFVGMGCSILIAIIPLIKEMSANGLLNSFYWLVAGGILYIIGALFYSFPQIKYMHTVFHLFVLAGSICHILAIYLIL